MALADPCPTELALIAHAQGLSSEEAIARHISDCPACRGRAERARARFLEASTAETKRLDVDETPPADGPAPERTSEPRRPEGGPAGPAAQIDRYLIRGLLGAGGMGLVYRAYDPKLDRHVALKLARLRARAEEGSEQERDMLRLRILRAAQAMARLSHAAVIQVHDAGIVGDQVFVAMELVEGGETLADWLTEKKRGWREVLERFVAAGRGLEAAHAAGIVHRDFKPQNVLIGRDGKVRVTDFGLARFAGERAPDARQRGAQLAQAGGTLGTAGEGMALLTPSQTITRDGMITGTPGYMAPEQMTGGGVDARTDLFSFCVALHEALYGVRPFEGDSLRALNQAAQEQRFRFSDAPVPERVKRAVLSGLKANPDERPASMTPLLERLSRLSQDPWRSRRRWAGGLAALLLLGGGGVWSARGLRRSECRGAEARLAGVWDGARREQVQKAFVATHLPYADKAWSTVSTTFDRYAADWSAMRTEACEATVVRREQPPDLLDLRMSCLDNRLRELAAASNLFAAADDEAVTHATAVVSALAPLAGCADARALRAPTAPTPEEKPQVDALRAREVAMNTLGNSGHVKPALALAQALLVDVRKLGYAPLEANLLWDIAYIQYRSDDFDGARRSFREAAAAGLRTGNDRSAALSWIRLVELGVQSSRPDDAAFAAQQAKAAAARLPSDVLLQVELGHALSWQQDFAGDYVGELRSAEEVVALAERAPENSQAMEIALETLGAAQLRVGHKAEALKTERRRLALAIARYGDEHPQAAFIEDDLGDAESQNGLSAAAREHLMHAIALDEKLYGKESSYALLAYEHLAFTRFNAGDPAEALAAAEHAAHIMSHQPITANNANIGFLAGLSLQALGRIDEARRRLEQSLELAKSIRPSEVSLQAIQIANALADLLIDDGKITEARKLVEPERALAEASIKDGTATGYTAETLVELGRLAAADGHLAQARRLIERALPLERDDGADNAESLTHELTLAEIERRDAPAAALARLERICALPLPAPGVDDLVDRDRANLLLARTLWANPKERARAKSLGQAARDGYAARGPGFVKQRKAAEQWLTSTASH